MAPQPYSPVPAPPVTVRLLEAPAPPPDREPAWVDRSWQATRRELLRFWRTSVAFAARPRETARLWSESRFDALNPLAYLLNTVAVLGPWRALWQRVLGVDTPLYLDVLWSAAPFFTVVVSASMIHGFLRLAGSTRRLTSTWAVSMYASGGILAIFQMLSTPFVLLSTNLRTPQQWHDHWLAFVLGQVFAMPAVVWLALAIAGLHGMRARRVILIHFLGSCAVGIGILVGSLELSLLTRALAHHGH